MSSTMKYVLFLLLFVLNAAVFAANSCSTIINNILSKWGVII